MEESVDGAGQWGVRCLFNVHRLLIKPLTLKKGVLDDILCVKLRIYLVLLCVFL